MWTAERFLTSCRVAVCINLSADNPHDSKSTDQTLQQPHKQSDATGLDRTATHCMQQVVNMFSQNVVTQLTKINCMIMVQIQRGSTMKINLQVNENRQQPGRRGRQGRIPGWWGGHKSDVINITHSASLLSIKEHDIMLLAWMTLPYYTYVFWCARWMQLKMFPVSGSLLYIWGYCKAWQVHSYRTAPFNR